jgi:hypothetical protein
MTNKQQLQKIFKGILHTGERKTVTNRNAQERVNVMREIDEHKTIRKESIMFKSISQQPSNMNKGERTKQIIIESSIKKNQQNYRNQKTPLSNNPKCKWP